MAAVRTAASHANAAAKCGAARYAAYAAGHAAAVGHVEAHELSAASYAIKAVGAAAPPKERETANGWGASGSVLSSS